MDLVGTRIGHIRIVGLLGRGGMGEVYAGFDEKLKRQVALKAIRRERRLSTEAKARFLREARLLSQLDHPRICRIFELIEGEEADFLVLERIAGTDLRHALAAGIPASHRLRIAAQIAEVLVAAHGKGVIHRDLKLENVMLTPEGSVKVLDFGLARSLSEAPLARQNDTLPAAGTRSADDDAPTQSRESRQETATVVAGSATDDGWTDPSHLATQPGRVMGTVSAMSPEQARGETISTAADLYAFGLLLQELFTGSSPYEPGLSPYLMLNRAAEGATLPVRGVDPDLAALIERLKSLAPATRPTAIDTLARLHWIADKPRRRRRQGLVAATLGVLTLLTLAMVVQTLRLGREAARANREAAAAQQVSTFLVDLFSVADPGEARGNAITARELLDRGADKISSKLQDQPQTQARLLGTIGVVYRKLGLYSAAEPLHRQALDLRRAHFGAAHPDVAGSLHELASVLHLQGRYDEAAPLFEQALAHREAALGPDHPAVARTLNELANLHWLARRLDEAEPLHRRALAIRRAALGPRHPEVAESLNSLATLFADQGRVAEAETYYREDLAISEAIHGSDHPDVATTLNNLATLYVDQGRFDEAEPLHQRAIAIRRQVLEPAHPSLAMSLHNLGRLKLKQARPSEAEPLLEEARAMWVEALGPEHGYVGFCLRSLAEVRHLQGQDEKAEALFVQALAIQNQAFGPEHPLTTGTRHAYEMMLRETGRQAEAGP